MCHIAKKKNVLTVWCWLQEKRPTPVYKIGSRQSVRLSVIAVLVLQLPAFVIYDIRG